MTLLKAFVTCKFFVSCVKNKVESKIVSVAFLVMTAEAATWIRVRVMVFNVTFNNISVISWWSVFIGGGNRSTQRKQQTCTSH